MTSQNNLSNLECIMQCEEGALMEPLIPSTHSTASHTNDGTLKWFKCQCCGGVFCLDKITRKWKLSAETYTDLLSRGMIKDRLEG